MRCCDFPDYNSELNIPLEIVTQKFSQGYFKSIACFDGGLKSSEFLQLQTFQSHKP